MIVVVLVLVVLDVFVVAVCRGRGGSCWYPWVYVTRGLSLRIYTGIT